MNKPKTYHKKSEILSIEWRMTAKIPAFLLKGIDTKRLPCVCIRHYKDHCEIEPVSSPFDKIRAIMKDEGIKIKL